MTQLKSQHRIFALDFLKAHSILAVVMFHGVFIPESYYEASKYWIDVLLAPLRVCVPMFFTISFFLLERSLDNGATKDTLTVIKQRLNRIISPTIAWFAIAGLIRWVGGVPLWLPLLQGRIFPGAYYLIAMVILIPIFIRISPHWSQSRTLPICCLFQISAFSLIYFLILNTSTARAVEILRSIGRSLPVYWIIYMALGSYFYRHHYQIINLSRWIPVYVKVTLILSCALLMTIEYAFMRHIVGGQPQPFEYSMVTCVLSVGVLFLSFADIDSHHLPSWFSSTISTLSRYSLGIFCSNGILSLVLLQAGTVLFQGQQLSFVDVLIVRFIGSLLLMGLSLQVCHILKTLGLRAWVQ